MLSSPAPVHRPFKKAVRREQSDAGEKEWMKQSSEELLAGCDHSLICQPPGQIPGDVDQFFLKLSEQRPHEFFEFNGKKEMRKAYRTWRRAGRIASAVKGIQPPLRPGVRFHEAMQRLREAFPCLSSPSSCFDEKIIKRRSGYWTVAVALSTELKRTLTPRLIAAIVQRPGHQRFQLVMGEAGLLPSVRTRQPHGLYRAPSYPSQWLDRFAVPNTSPDIEFQGLFPTDQEGSGALTGIDISVMPANGICLFQGISNEPRAKGPDHQPLAPRSATSFDTELGSVFEAELEGDHELTGIDCLAMPSDDASALHGYSDFASLMDGNLWL